jgi:hypothetical protein
MNNIIFDNRDDRFISIIADDISVVVSDVFQGFVSNNNIK